MKDNKLEINDAVYDYGVCGEVKRSIITRVTKTMAFGGRNRYKINVTDGAVNLVGGNYGGRVNDKRMEDEFNAQELINKIASPTILKSLSNETLEMIVTIMYGDKYKIQQIKARRCGLTYWPSDKIK